MGASLDLSARVRRSESSSEACVLSGDSSCVQKTNQKRACSLAFQGREPIGNGVEAKERTNERVFTPAEYFFALVRQGSRAVGLTNH